MSLSMTSNSLGTSDKIGTQIDIAGDTTCSYNLKNKNILALGDV